ncbi:MAG: hypothetical protein AB8G22_20665 [Saprospiraceae bacterium]
MALSPFSIIKPPYPNFQTAEMLFTKENQPEILIFDHSPVYSYPFPCPTCNRSHFSIEVNPDPYQFNWSVASNFRASLVKTKIETTTGIGVYGNIIHCDHCTSYFYIGLGYEEPNNSRDVFTLHCIWAVKANVIRVRLRVKIHN